MQRYLIAAIVAIVGLVTTLSFKGKAPSLQPPRASQAVTATAPSDCTTSATRPCYDRQTGKKTTDLIAQGGENAFAACLRNNSPRQAGQVAAKTAACQEEIVQFCYEGKGDVLLRKFDGTCKAASCPSLPFVKFVSGVEPKWDDPAINIGLRTIFRSKNGVLYVSGFQAGSIVGKIYKSVDNGQSWTAAAVPSGEDPYYGSYVRRIIESANGVLYASGYRLWKSTDGGAAWSIISQSIADITAGVSVDDVVESKDGSMIALVRHSRSYGSEYNEVYKSSDGGSTWKRIAGPLFESYAGYNFIEADDGALLFATSGGIYRYVNGELAKTLVTDIYGGSMTFLKSKSGSIFIVGGDPATPSDAVISYRSDDNGLTWRKGDELPYSRLVAEDALVEASDGSLWTAAWSLCGDAMAYTSIDQGSTWQAAATSPVSQYANIIDYNSIHGPFIIDIAEGNGGKIFTVPFEFAAIFEVPR